MQKRGREQDNSCMATQIPSYALYGDQAQPAWLAMVHFEWIPERSSLFEYEIAPHFHDGQIQLLYVTDGGGEVFIDDAKWRLAPRTLVVVPARHVHGFHFTPDIDGPVVTAAQRPLESLAAVAAPGVLPYLHRPLVLGVLESMRHADALMPLFEALAREVRAHSSGEVAAGSALLLAVFVQIARIAKALHGSGGDDAASRSRKAVPVERFRALVDARFRERLAVQAYAAALGLSAGQLSRLCRDALGRSALAVINARVVHEAERELVYSTLAVKQIAGLLGFADEAYFGRFFKRRTGHTPTDFREAARRRLAPTQKA